MAEYIERVAAVKVVLRGRKPTNSVAQNRMLSIIQHDLLTMRAADVAPVVYGRWGTGRFNLETGNYEEQCTRCRNFSKEYGKPYCPNCGAKMDIENGSVDHDA